MEARENDKELSGRGSVVEQRGGEEEAGGEHTESEPCVSGWKLWLALDMSHSTLSPHSHPLHLSLHSARRTLEPSFDIMLGVAQGREVVGDDREGR